PFDQRASGRRLNVYVLPSALTLQLFATPGAGPAFLSRVVRPSHRSRKIPCASTERAFCGSSESGSAPPPLKSIAAGGAVVSVTGEREQAARARRTTARAASTRTPRSARIDLVAQRLSSGTCRGGEVVGGARIEDTAR